MPPAEAPADCRLCPRLVAFRRANAARRPDWHNRPVISFGDPQARLLVVGLAPGLSGANRTGRPFTGDGSGALLFDTLAMFGFANDRFAGEPEDGLVLRDCLVTNAVACVPPGNRPLAAEIDGCRPFLAARLAALPRLRIVLCLGTVAHGALLRALGRPTSAIAFGHGARHSLAGLAVFDSYHCSRYNTNTGRLTPPMLQEVVGQIRALLG